MRKLFPALLLFCGLLVLAPTVQSQTVQAPAARPQTAPQQPPAAQISPSPQASPRPTVQPPKGNNRIELEEVPPKDHKLTPEEAKDLLASVEEVLKFVGKDTLLPIKHDVKKRIVSR